MEVSEVSLYEKFRHKVGEEEAQMFVEYVESKVESEYIRHRDVLATKDDLANMRLEINDEFTNTKDDLANMRLEINDEFTKVRNEITDLKIELIGKIRDSNKELNGKISDSNKELNGKINELKIELNGKIKGLETEMHKQFSLNIKWMFIFWIGQLFAISGIIFALYKFFPN